jgi:hypothetical protein
MIEQRPGERIDDLQRSRLQIIQNPSGFCFGMDAVLLSGFVTVKPGEFVVDLCSGSGIIPLLLSAKTKAKRIIGIELQKEMADMATRSVELNHLSPRVEIRCADLRDRGAAGESGTIDVVTCNPPYMAVGGAIRNPDDAKAIARHEIYCTLEDTVRETGRLLKNGGRCAYVYRPNRLIELISALRRFQMEPKRMKLVHPFLNREANMVLLEAVKGGRAALRVEAPLVVFQRPGVYSDEIRDIYGY